MDGVKYKLWRTIFIDLCTCAKVSDDITNDPPTVRDEDWISIDAKIETWYYNTVEANLLQIMIKEQCTAKDLWDNIEEFFTNNKMSRALQLKETFYSPVIETRLVIQILRQLPSSYNSMKDIITNTQPFPTFVNARNMLLLHESRDEHSEPQHEPVLDSSTALYHTTRQNNTGKGKNKSNKNRGNNRRAPKGGATNSGVAVSFDPFGFTVKDFNIGAFVQRCNSHGDLYPVVPREFNNSPFLNVLKTNGIKIRFSCPYTSQQNGKAERTIQTINNIIRTLLFQASLPSTFCVEALYMSVHVLNLLPTTTLSYRAPFELLYWFFPTYTYLRVFGCLCSNLSFTSKHKLSPRSAACVYLGPSSDHRGSRCLDLITQRVHISHHVTFDEDHFPYSSFHSTPSTCEYNVFGNEDTLFVTPGHVPLTLFVGPHKTPSDASLAPSNDTPTHRNGRVVSRDHQPHTPTRPSPYVTSDSTSHQPPHHESGGAAPDLSHVQPTDPLVLDSGSLPLLLTHPMVTRSQTSSIRTVNILTFIATTVVPPLPWSTAHAILVTIQTVLSIVVSRHWPIHQLDVKNAFQNEYLIEEAPRAWYHRFAVFIASIGFVNSKSDNSIFTYHRGCDTIYLLLYVDDIILTVSSVGLVHRVISRLSTEFAMDYGELSYFFDIAASRSSSGLFLSQFSFARDILARTGMSTRNSCTTPVDTKSKLSSLGTRVSVSDPTLYRSLADALQYLTFSRLDITFAVQQVFLFMHDPREPHMDALKYRLVSYTDADWAGCLDTRRSTYRFCVFLCDNLVSWSSKRQHVANVVAEAEYRGIANVVAEAA
uniref:Integrase catalytic domain-containing protein n=1 Tax=Tanacetum cinerariifolium TaxID=118510 RepID=A0A6L2JGR7_TANCI|nr:hypothetical protein [Tanacetum cinerariifolium]